MKISRKDFLESSTKYAAGAVIGAVAADALTNRVIAGVNTAWPFPYQALDIEKVRILGHDLYYDATYGGCCFGAFAALVNASAALPGGDAFVNFPNAIMLYGGGGGASWGGTCGAVNGSAAFIALVTAKADATALESEVYGWYTQTKFPTDISNQYGVQSKYTQNKYTQALTQNTSGSILCHASIAEWCKAASLGQGTTERKERCARLTGDVAAYAAQILNDKLAGKFSALYVAPASVATCTNLCHSSTITAKMDCVQCHGTPHGTTGITVPEGTPSGYMLENNYPNPFNPSTRIQFSIPAAATVDIAIYDIHGRLVRNLVGSEHHESGRYSVEWDAKDNAGHRVASGSYFCRMQAGQFSTTKKLTLLK